MTFDLLAEMERDGFSSIRHSTSRGGQYNGHCIFSCHGLGHDRLWVQPNYGDYGWFKCNGCGTKGSGVDYLMIKSGMSRNEALKTVGWKPRDGSEPKFIIPKSAYMYQPTHEMPNEIWQRSAIYFAEYCMDMLWGRMGREALAYLRARGLKDETIRAAEIGYNPTEKWRPGEKWGREKKQFLAQGIVIPWFVGNELWRITIRDENAVHPDPRYRQVWGGSNGLYLASYLHYPRPVILVEGEFDALSIAQEAGKHVVVCATGSTEGSHTAKWIASLAVKERVLVAFDAEEKGDIGAQWWMETLENAQRLRPWWKDANQMLQDGIDLLNDWILPAL